jgi:hypothetical protein
MNYYEDIFAFLALVGFMMVGTVAWVVWIERRPKRVKF